MCSPFLYFSWYLRKSILLLICFVSYARTIKLCKYFVRVNICARVKVCMPTLYTSNFLSKFIMEKMMQYVCDVCVGYQFSKQNIILMLHDILSSQYKYIHRKIKEIYRKKVCLDFDNLQKPNWTMLTNLKPLLYIIIQHYLNMNWTLVIGKV